MGAVINLNSSTRLIDQQTCFSFSGHPRKRRLEIRRRIVVVPGEKKKTGRAACMGMGVFTGDELHYVAVPNSNWEVALWRYLPSPHAPKRNHPLLLLSGIGINALGLDLSPQNSLARYMAGEVGYDTWTLELRGVGLSRVVNKTDSHHHHHHHHHHHDINSGFLPLSFNFIQNGISSRQKDYCWDFQNHLEEDLPAAMEYIRRGSKSKDGKVGAIGHSMGGILLYAAVARHCSQGTDPPLSSLITLGSSLQYSSSRTPLKMLLPLVSGAQGLDIPAITSGTLANLTHQYPFGNHLISHAFTSLIAQNTTQPDLLEKMFNMLCLLPSKLYLQLATTLEEHGLCNRDRTLFYKDHLHKTQVPILAVAGDQDAICPPEAVYETAKHIPKNLVNYKVFGDSGGPHYDHYDIVSGHLARDRVYPYIVDFLNQHDIP